MLKFLCSLMVACMLLGMSGDVVASESVDAVVGTVVDNAVDAVASDCDYCDNRGWYYYYDTTTTETVEDKTCEDCGEDYRTVVGTRSCNVCDHVVYTYWVRDEGCGNIFCDNFDGHTEYSERDWCECSQQTRPCDRCDRALVDDAVEELVVASVAEKTDCDYCEGEGWYYYSHTGSKSNATAWRTCDECGFEVVAEKEWIYTCLNCRGVVRKIVEKITGCEYYDCEGYAGHTMETVFEEYCDCSRTKVECDFCDAEMNDKVVVEEDCDYCDNRGWYYYYDTTTTKVVEDKTCEDCGEDYRTVVGTRSCNVCDHVVYTYWICDEGCGNVFCDNFDGHTEYSERDWCECSQQTRPCDRCDRALVECDFCDAEMK